MINASSDVRDYGGLHDLIELQGTTRLFNLVRRELPWVLCREDALTN